MIAGMSAGRLNNGDDMDDMDGHENTLYGALYTSCQAASKPSLALIHE